jgi:hypothetical protein
MKDKIEAKKVDKTASVPAVGCETTGYARPSTRGELWDLLLDGVQCEVVTSNVEITRHLIDGWLGSLDYKVRPSENEGWSVFEA